MGGLCALAPSGCGDEVTRYQRPDGSVWDAGISAPWRENDLDLTHRYAFISNNWSDSVTILDVVEGRTIANYPVGVAPLALNGPHHVAIDLLEGAAYALLLMPPPVILPGPHAGHGASTLPGVLMKRSFNDFRLLGRVDLDPNPGDLRLSPDGRRAYVSHFDLVRAAANQGNRAAQLSNLLVIDTRTMQRLHSIPVCVSGHGMLVAPDGRTVYVSCYGDDALAVVSFVSDPPSVRLVPIRGQLAQNPASPTYGPYFFTPSPDGNTLWMSCWPPYTSAGNRGLLIAFDTRTNTFDVSRSTSSLIGTPFYGTYSADGASLLMPLQGRDGIARIAATGTFRVMEQVPVDPSRCVAPRQITRSPDGRLFMVCEGIHTPTRREPGSVVVLDPDDLSITASYPMGVYSDAISFPGAAWW